MQPTKTRANHPTGCVGGRRFFPPKCGNCAPKFGNLEESPEMIRTDPQTLYLWQVRARPAWYQMPDGGLMLEYTAMKSPIFTAGVGWAFSISCLFQWFFVRLEATVQTPVVGGQSDTTCTGSPTSCRPPAGGRPTGIGHETRRNHHRRAAQGHRDAVCAARPVCLSGDGPRTIAENGVLIAAATFGVTLDEEDGIRPPPDTNES
jgi:hypothetical protein